jgi:hypothetical protein
MTITDETTFYGPYPCERCGQHIVRSSIESGGVRFDIPEAVIYPNTLWHTHRCQGAQPPVVVQPLRLVK